VGSGCTILRGDVGVRDPCSLTIQGQRKETLNRTLAAQLELGGNPTSGRHPSLDLSRVGPSITMKMCGLMSGLAPLNQPRGYHSISLGRRFGGDSRSHNSIV
jgi:hypothetical protein